MTTLAQEQAVTAEVKTNPHTIVLDEPIKRGEQVIDQITLRKPKAGELRGIALSDLLKLDVLAVMKVLPRISLPSISEAEARSMDPADLVQVGVQISDFLLQRSLKVELSPDA